MATIKLRYMSACVETNANVDVLIRETGEVINIPNAVVLTSYKSRVAVYDGERVYLLPRYDYSNTTWQHLHAFLEDYCHNVPHLYAKEMRKVANGGIKNGEYPLYTFASGIDWANMPAPIRNVFGFMSY